MPSFASTGTTRPSARLAKAGITFEALDNGFAAVSDPAALQRICDQLGPEQIDALLRKWLARLPHPFTPDDRDAGYRYDISILQAEFSLTQMLGPTRDRTGVLRTGHPGQSQCRAPRSGQPDLRPPHPEPQTTPGPLDSSAPG